jgi:antitoxin component YwqK of YwqJK toxin-antitoxin module
MKQGKRITATIVIGSALIFGGCNAASTDKAENEKQYTDTAEIIQEAVPAPKQSSTKPQTKDTTINQKDKQGRRQGLWIEGNNNNRLLEEVYYYNNRKNGFYRGYYSNGRLGYLGEYNNDKPLNSARMMTKASEQRLLVPYKAETLTIH